MSKVEATITNAEASNLSLQNVRAPYTAASSFADDAFAPLNKLATRITRGFKASGAEDSAVEDLMIGARKLQGGRKSPAPTDDAFTPNVSEAEKGHSASQMSRVLRVAALDAMVATLELHKLYDPNQPELKVSALISLSNDLRSKNRSRQRRLNHRPTNVRLASAELKTPSANVKSPAANFKPSSANVKSPSAKLKRASAWL